MLAVVLFKDTLLTATLVELTVTEHVAVLLPSAVLTVIVALPADTPLTSPLVDTVATAVLLLLHVTALLVALDGAIVAVKVSLFPTRRLVDALFKVTPVTDTVPLPPLEMLTEQVAVLLPSAVLTVIIALPVETALTWPLADTVATAVLLLLHNTYWFVALAGATVAVKVSEPPTVSESAALFKETPVTGTLVPLLVTLTAQVAILPPSTVVAVIAVLPALMPITTPFVTIATSGTLLLHVTSLFVAFAGETVAFKVSKPPTAIEAVVLLRLTPVTATLSPPLPVCGVSCKSSTVTGEVSSFEMLVMGMVPLISVITDISPETLLMDTVNEDSETVRVIVVVLPLLTKLVTMPTLVFVVPFT
jgi:hypothetical protein